MTKNVRAAFELETRTISLEQILPVRTQKPGFRRSTRYEAIAASVKEVGIIEPLVVAPHANGYLLLDGHVRLEVLKEMGTREVDCLISTDDEGYTYNHRVNRLAAIQANRMILKALDAGVPEDRIARALHVEVSQIRRSRNLLANICAEAIELLKDKPIPEKALTLFKKVKPMRQIEMAELMGATGSYTVAYASVLVGATKREQLVAVETKETSSPEDLAKIAHEMQSLERDFVVLDESYGKNVLQLTLARGYLQKLLDNARVVKYLAQKSPEVLSEIQKIVDATSLEA